MQLSDLRTEVLNKGFDPTLFSADRLNRYLNDGYLKICRRVDYYVDESTYDFTTTNGTTKYPLPSNWARIRNLWDQTRNIVILPTGLRDIDAGGVPPIGPPSYYALDAQNLHLWPTPDATYSLELRYWILPNNLVNDTDVPTLPADYHNLLWIYATWQCFESEDDPSMGQYWEGRFEKELAMFAADAKFPDTETPDIAKSMWDQDRGLTQKGWSVWNWE